MRIRIRRSKPKHARRPVTRAEFEAAVAELVETDAGAAALSVADYVAEQVRARAQRRDAVSPTSPSVRRPTTGRAFGD